MVSIKRRLISNLKNISSGAKVPAHIVVFESDDWGSNRIASKTDFIALVKQGILSENCSVYDKCDTIARKDDFNHLFEVLSKYQGSDGRNAIISAFMNPVNPDFSKIQESDFSHYYYETFLETLEKTGEKEGVLNKWNEGISNHLIYPEYHGREHLTVPLWMDALKQGDELVTKAFEYNYYAVNTKGCPPKASRYRPTLYFENLAQKEWLKDSLADGLDIIHKIFGLNPIVFAPSNGISHPEFDEILYKKGIIAIHNSKRFEPDGMGGGKISNYGMKNILGQIFYNRNCVFEPVQVSYDAVDQCLSQIQGAFNWHKAAIVSTHRVNYMGTIDSKNRELGLRELDRLLKSVTNKWPDVIFMTTEEYINSIKTL